jgi:glycosyltransferase involved in cell wall biosynthesis
MPRVRSRYWSPGSDETHLRALHARRRRAIDASRHISVVVPTLNEEEHLGSLLSSLAEQSHPPLEVIVVDGGSSDATLEVARGWGARAMVSAGATEFRSRNLGAQLARGSILLFTGADVVLPHRVLENIWIRFTHDPALTAIAGPGIPIDPPWLLGIEYKIYNSIRYAVARLPGSLKRFTTSTNILAVRSAVFADLGGFEEDVNADGRFGAKVCAYGKTRFSYREVRARISSRRLESMGFLEFNRHFLYVLENFFPRASQWGSVRRRKEISALRHIDLHVTSQSVDPATSATVAADGAKAMVDLSDGAVVDGGGQ